MKNNMRLLQQILFLFQIISTHLSLGEQIARSITMMNEGGRRVDIHWVHPDTGEMVLQSNPDLLNGASMELNSYVGHTFQVRELPAKKTGVCAGEDETCRIDHFTVNSNHDQGKFIMDTYRFHEIRKNSTIY